MRLRWHGTAALTIESGGVTIAVDPFVGMPPGMSDAERLKTERADIFRAVDAVLVTHGHFDHIYDIAALYAGTDTPIYATKTPIGTLRAQGLSDTQLGLITPAREFAVGDFHITAYQSRHCTFDLAVILKTVFRRATLRRPKRLIELLRLNKAYPEGGETLMYEIEAEGRRVQLMGSMGMAEGVDYPVGADLLILPFQGTGNPARTVAPIVARLRPKRILLDHYDDAFPPMSAQIKTEDFEKKMTSAGIPTEAMKTDTAYYVGEGLDPPVSRREQ